ncbi:MAG: class I SAM-dependent DNA methyltransferase [Alphaproteobacteria bacterium]
MADYRERLYQSYRAAAGTDLPDRIDAFPAGMTDFLNHVVSSYFPPDRGAEIVDLGCGAGLLIHTARQAGYRRVSGVDISPEQVAAAKRMGIDGVTEGNIMAALDGAAEASLDAVTTFDVIEHLTKNELLEMIDAIHRVLKPGGRWIIHTVNAESPNFGRMRHGDLTHEQAFTRTSLTQAARACGFSRISCYEDIAPPRRVPSLARWVVWKLFRAVAVVRLAAEIGGDARNAVLTQNLIAVATR